MGWSMDGCPDGYVRRREVEGGGFVWSLPTGCCPRHLLEEHNLIPRNEIRRREAKDCHQPDGVEDNVSPGVRKHPVKQPGPRQVRAATMPLPFQGSFCESCTLAAMSLLRFSISLPPLSPSLSLPFFSSDLTNSIRRPALEGWASH